MILRAGTFFVGSGCFLMLCSPCLCCQRSIEPSVHVPNTTTKAATTDRTLIGTAAKPTPLPVVLVALAAPEVLLVGEVGIGVAPAATAVDRAPPLADATPTVVAWPLASVKTPVSKLPLSPSSSTNSPVVRSMHMSSEPDAVFREL